jgi:hypothetical protein
MTREEAGVKDVSITLSRDGVVFDVEIGQARDGSWWASATSLVERVTVELHESYGAAFEALV